MQLVRTNSPPLLSPIGITPEQKATEETQQAIRQRGDVTKDTVDFDLLRTLNQPYSIHDPIGLEEKKLATYYYDLVGDTSSQAIRYRDQLLRTFTTFLTLPDDAKIELTTKKDEVCRSCTFQKHCDLPDKLDGDASYLGVYEDVVKYLAANGREIDTPTKNKDGSLLATAKSVREVMSYFALAGTEFKLSAIYADALARRAEYGNVFGGPSLPDVARYNQQYAE